MKTMKGIRVRSFRQEIPIEELDIMKNQLDILTMKAPWQNDMDEIGKKHESVARLNDTAIIYYNKWQNAQEQIRELVTKLEEIKEAYYYWQANGFNMNLEEDDVKEIEKLLAKAEG